MIALTPTTMHMGHIGDADITILLHSTEGPTDETMEGGGGTARWARGLSLVECEGAQMHTI